MVAPKPKTIVEELFDSINLYISESNYLESDSFQIKKLLRDADKLMGPDPAQANIAKAMIYQLCGDIEKVYYHIRIANTLPICSRSNLLLNSSISLSNLFMYEDAQYHYNLITEPNDSERSFINEAGRGCLSLIKLMELMTKAREMNLHFDDKDVELTTRATDVLKKHRIVDSDLAKYAGIFGEVLRENKLMIKTRFPDVIVGDVSNGWYPETVFITFKVNTDVTTAARLYKESVQRLLSNFKSIPDAVHFSIEAY